MQTKTMTADVQQARQGDVRMFAKNRAAKDGLYSHCTDCHRVKGRSGSVLRVDYRDNPDSRDAVKALRSAEAEKRAKQTQNKHER